jgi:hypothetical protein
MKIQHSRVSKKTGMHTSPGHYLVVGLLAVVTLIVGFVLYRAHREHRELGLATVCRCNLCQILLALRNYQDIYGCFPPAYLTDQTGRPVHSWRVLTAGCDGGVGIDFYEAYDFAKPWDGPENIHVIDREWGDVFACPADPDAVSLNRTSYVAVIGDNTFWPGQTTYSMEDLDSDWENKILLIEIPDSDIPWMEPRDISMEGALELFSTLPALTDGRHPEGLHYVTAGGRVGLISRIGTQDQFKQMLQVRKGKR